MFCKKCGKRIPDDAQACENCGMEIAPEASVDTSDIADEVTGNVVSEETTTAGNDSGAQNDVTAEENKKETSAQVQASLNPNQAQTALYNNQTVQQEQSENEKNSANEKKIRSELEGKKKKIKKRTIVISIISAILCIALIILTFPYIKNAFARLFMSSEDYFAYVVKNNSKENAKSIANTLTDLKKTALNGSSSSGTVNMDFDEPFHAILADVTSDIKMEGTAASIIGKFVDLSVSGLTAWIDEAAVSYEIKSDGTNSQTVMNLDVNDTKFGKVDVVTDETSGVTYVGVPDYNEKYFIAGKKAENGTNDAVEISENILTAFPKKELTEKLLMKYIECMAENVGDVKEKTGKMDAGKFSKKVVVLTAEIDEKEMKNITDKLLSEIKKDKDTQAVIKKVAISSGMSEEQVINSIEKGFEDFNRFYSSELNGKLSLTLYVDAKGTIIGTAIYCNKFEFSNCSITKLFEIGNTISGKIGPATFELEGNGKLKSGKVKLDYALEVAGFHTADIKITDLDYEKMKDGLYDAKIGITFDGNIAKIGEMLFKATNDNSIISKLIKYVPEFSLDIDLLQKSEDETEVAVQIKHNGKSAADIKVSNKTGEKKNVELPGEYVDMKEIGIMEFFKTTDMEKFLGFLETANFPKAGLIKSLYKLGGKFLF